MLLLIHNNPVGLAGGALRVDRKFHDGMLNYVANIRAPKRAAASAHPLITTVHPLAAEGDAVMDPVTLPVAELPYRVLGIPLDRRGVVTPEGARLLDETVAASALVVGYGYGSAAMAQRHGKRCIACLEYDLQTQLVVTKSFARDPLRALVAQAKCWRDWRREMVPAMRTAHQIHCNGYPIHEAAAAYNPRRLLYFDSRMSASMVITEDALAQRLRVRAGMSVAPRRTKPLTAPSGVSERSGRGGPSTRLVYSGRYEPMKGALDAVKAAAACLEMGLDITMDTWGQGSQVGAMRSIADASGGAIRVHDAIPFPELVKKTHDADLFVCCHIQSDPSCTYLESMGAGLPIVGYANRMWSAMAKDSLGGVVAQRNTPDALAGALAQLLKSPGAVEETSHRARRFAAAHAFELEFARRTDAINAALEEGAAAPRP